MQVYKIEYFFNYGGGIYLLLASSLVSAILFVEKQKEKATNLSIGYCELINNLQYTKPVTEEVTVITSFEFEE